MQSTKLDFDPDDCNAERYVPRFILEKVKSGETGPETWQGEEPAGRTWEFTRKTAGDADFNPWWSGSSYITGDLKHSVASYFQFRTTKREDGSIALTDTDFKARIPVRENKDGSAEAVRFQDLPWGSELVSDSCNTADNSKKGQRKIIRRGWIGFVKDGQHMESGQIQSGDGTVTAVWRTVKSNKQGETQVHSGLRWCANLCTSSGMMSECCEESRYVSNPFGWKDRRYCLLDDHIEELQAFDLIKA